MCMFDFGVCMRVSQLTSVIQKMQSDVLGCILVDLSH